jgi:hypothetical protein
LLLLLLLYARATVPVVRTYACARACVFVGVCSARVTVDAPLPWSISAQNRAK